MNKYKFNSLFQLSIFFFTYLNYWFKKMQTNTQTCSSIHILLKFFFFNVRFGSFLIVKQ